MSEDKRSRLKQWLSSGEATLHPATIPQRELWEVSPVPPGHPCNNICTVTTVKGQVSRGLCEKAIALVVEKQEALRLSILPGKDGPVQLVKRKIDPVLQFHTMEAGLGPHALDERIDGLTQKPFDLVKGPLYRVEIIRQGEETYTLVLVIHHAIADGWTLGVFMTDLFTAYASQVLGVSGPLEPVPQTYTEWGAADRKLWHPREIRARQPFWLKQMAGAERLFDAPEIVDADAGRRCRWVSEMPGEMIESLRELSSRLGSTLFSTMLAAFQVLMARASGKNDILVGSPVAQRNKKSSWETMGSYAGIVPLRSQIDRNLSFADQVSATHQMSLDCFANAMPFTELVKCLNEPVLPGRNPVFDVRFALQNHPVPDVSMPGMEVDYRTRSTGTARFDLACELTEVGSFMEAVWLYRDDMFSESEIANLHDQYMLTLTIICDEPEKSVGTLIGLLT